MSRRKKTGRDVDGILLLDKPLGISSNAALQQAKRIFNANKAGHTGSLDPLATGMLPLCFGTATKICGFLLEANKSYAAELQLGVTTTTGDAEGQIVKTRELLALDDLTISVVVKKFTGVIQQIPPMYSALKQEGQRLYSLARQNITVDRNPRTITIFKINVLSYQPPYMQLDITCSKGTYIRTLAEDIGEALGCGAHLRALRRTSVGPFQSANSVTLETLAALANEGISHLDSLLLPADSALADFPRLTLSEAEARDIRHGKLITITDAPLQGLIKLYCLTDNQEEFVGMAFRREDGQLQSKRLF